MSETTYIKGKDESLENSIEKMQTLLADAGFEIAEASWQNPVPHIYSVHIHDKRCPGLFTNGKGTSRKACLASALGEFIERLSSNYFFSDYWLDCQPLKHDFLYYPDEKSLSLEQWRETLTPNLWDFYDEDQNYQNYDLLSLNDQSHQIRCLPLQSQGRGETVYFPMSVLSNIYASNGLCAGNTLVEAKVQGLSEVFERWVKNTILRENLCLPEVPESVVSQFHDVVEARAALQKEGIEVSIRDASLGGRFPVINVTLFEKKSGRCFASFGSHPIFEVALERTLTESLQGRQLGNLDGFQTPVFDAEAVADDENIENHFIDSSGLIHVNFISNQADFEFVHWDFNGTTEQQWQHLLELVYEQGSDVYVGEYLHFGVPACRIVVPGLSEIYPPEELVENNQNIGRRVRDLLSTMKDATELEWQTAVDELDSLGLSEHQGIASLIGLMPDPGSFWSQVQVCDLRFWCLLAAQDYEEAFEALQEVLYFVDTNSDRGVRYRAFAFALEMMLNGQEEEGVFSTLFEASVVEKVWRNLRGEENFWGAPLGEEVFTSSARHQAMLDIYQQVQDVKARAS